MSQSVEFTACSSGSRSKEGQILLCMKKQEASYSEVRGAIVELVICIVVFSYKRQQSNEHI